MGYTVVGSAKSRTFRVLWLLEELGEQMTLADVLLVHCANWAATARFPEAPEALGDYAERLRARPAFQRVTAL